MSDNKQNLQVLSDEDRDSDFKKYGFTHPFVLDPQERLRLNEMVFATLERAKINNQKHT